ncbi:MAG: hypothetical protein II314_06415, partial [Prevotella sp.]|nr:hypothetical protein [Prevotella sp.]
MADIRNMPFENKLTQGEIIVCMPPEQTLTGVQDLTLKTDSRTEQTSELATASYSTDSARQKNLTQHVPYFSKAPLPA